MNYGGKEFQVQRAKFGNHYEVSFTKGGEIPKDLKGLFTSTGEAEDRIKTFIELNPKKTANPKSIPSAHPASSKKVVASASK